MTISAPQFPVVQPTAATFDLFRLSKAKKEVDISPGTIRKYIKMGLPCYRMEKAAFISRMQLHQFIITRATALANAAA